MALAAIVLRSGAAAHARAPDIAHGRHIATVLAGCADCHGANFAGGRVFRRPGFTVYAANLTSEAGGIAALGDPDLRRAIAAGVAPDGTKLLVMPAREYDDTDPERRRRRDRSRACHGATLAGGVSPDGARGPNNSHDGIGTWTFGQFETAMRTGATPDGRVLSKVMPWERIGKMTDDELRALYDYLESPGS